MESVFLVIHIFLALAIIGLVLLQRSEGGGLGMGSGGMGALASVQSTANILTRLTAICAAGFFATSLILGVLTGSHSSKADLMNKLETVPPAATAPAEAPAKTEAAPAPETPPPAPSAPVAE